MPELHPTLQSSDRRQLLSAVGFALVTSGWLSDTDDAGTSTETTQRTSQPNTTETTQSDMTPSPTTDEPTTTDGTAVTTGEVQRRLTAYDEQESIVGATSHPTVRLFVDQSWRDAVTTSDTAFFEGTSFDSECVVVVEAIVADLGQQLVFAGVDGLGSEQLVLRVDIEQSESGGRNAEDLRALLIRLPTRGTTPEQVSVDIVSPSGDTTTVETSAE